MARRDLVELDATAQLVALASRRVSAVELLKAVLARHEQTHAALNAVVAIDLERALAGAGAVDEQRARGEHLGPLAGLPMTVKDSLDVAGLPASSGMESLRRRQAEDAVAVAHARRAGAVIWGKTNVPPMAGDWQTANRLYGRTRNPWDLGRTPGGSSGGAAAALAAGVTTLEIGSDIGGSLRVPASFCGVFAHKPTWGTVSQQGHVPPRPGSFAERDLNVIGPMARSARDLRLLLSVLEDGPLAARAPAADLSATRIGLWLDAPGFPLDPEVRAVLERFGGETAAAGAQVTPIASPVEPEQMLETYLLLLACATAEDLPAKTLRRAERLRGPARIARRLGAGPFSWATAALGRSARHVEWVAADARRALLRRQLDEAFERFEVILAPAAPVAAFPHDARPFEARRLATSEGLQIPYRSLSVWTALASALGLPATSAPAGLTAAGLPVGVQIIGPRGSDSRTLAVAQALDENVRGFVAPPEPA